MANKISITLLCSTITLALAAEPVVSQVEWAWNSDTRKVLVSYNLSEEAIVTMDVCTNGAVSIGGAHVVSLVGDVNREVSAGENRTIMWFADRDWPGNSVSAGNVSIVVKAWKKSVPPDYLVVDLRMTNTATCCTLRYYSDASFIPYGVTNDIYKTKMLVMRRIPADGVTWLMGSPSDETGRSSNEPEHYVSFSSDYYIGIYPVTMGQYRQLCGTVPGNAMGTFDMSIVTNADCHPVGGISYAYNSGDASQSYLMRTAVWPGDQSWSINNFKMDGFFRRLYGITAIKFNLPTDAQWEYACRAGLNTAFNNGKGNTVTQDARPCQNLDEVGWYDANTSTTQPVGLKQSNRWGVYDMHGNVWEWCLDWQGTISETAESDPVSNPAGAASGTRRVRRGGGYSSGAKYCRSGTRGDADPKGNYVNHGFRLCCPVPAN